jgi:hypothetical protein
MVNNNEVISESYQYVINNFGIEKWVDQIIDCYKLILHKS